VKPVQVLIAVEDLSLHQAIDDILEIGFKEVEIDRALSTEVFLERLRESERRYDVIVYDLRCDEETDTPGLADVVREFPQVTKRLVVVATSAESIRHNSAADGVAWVRYPLSLDAFVDTVRRVYEESGRAGPAPRSPGDRKAG
jgi:DNA-binding NtrC family response regulator